MQLMHDVIDDDNNKHAFYSNIHVVICYNTYSSCSLVLIIGIICTVSKITSYTVSVSSREKYVE